MSTDDSGKKRKINRMHRAELFKLGRYIDLAANREIFKDKTSGEILNILSPLFPNLGLSPSSVRRLLRDAEIEYRTKPPRSRPIAASERNVALASFVLDCVMRLDAGVPLDEAAIAKWCKYSQRVYAPRDVRVKRLKNPQLDLNLDLIELPDDE